VSVLSARRTALARALVLLPSAQHIIAHPQRENSTLDQSFVIFCPVAETVLLLGSPFLAHIKDTSTALSVAIYATTPKDVFNNR
jgi:hypothetical protein